MNQKPKESTLDSLYLPLIIAIPANILLLFRLSLYQGINWIIVPYAVFTFFLLATGYMSVRSKRKKSKIFGFIYLAAGVIFILLAFFVI